MISGTPLRVVLAIHFNHEPGRRREEVNDEATDRHLPAELHSELARANDLPEGVFRRGRCVPHGASVAVEPKLLR